MRTNIGEIEKKERETTEKETDECFVNANTVYSENLSREAVDEKVKDVILFDGKTVNVKYDRSFMAKLIQADEAVQNRYSQIKNHLLSYEKAHSRISWSGESFVNGRNIFAKLSIRGKTIFLNLPLNPADYVDSKYKVENTENIQKYEKIPLRVRIKSERSVRYAVELIQIAAQRNGLTPTEMQNKKYTFDYDTTENLIEKKLIKLIPTHKKVGSGADKNTEVIDNEPRRLPIEKLEKRETISAVEAPSVMSTELANQMIKSIKGKTIYTGKKDIINIDQLSAAFLPGDTVTLQKLKEKKLISAKSKAVKVLARGVLDKPLTVIAQDYSIDAIKMILIVGGEVWKD